MQRDMTFNAELTRHVIDLFCDIASIYNTGLLFPQIKNSPIIADLQGAYNSLEVDDEFRDRYISVMNTIAETQV